MYAGDNHITTVVEVLVSAHARIAADATDATSNLIKGNPDIQA